MARFGHDDDARELATLVFDADPSDADAAITLLVTAAHSADHQALAEAAKRASSSPLRPPSEAARRALLELLGAWLPDETDQAH
jgi:hypothetical protein